MEIQPDFKELLALLNAHDVAYIVVGAHALAFHGAPRYTGDIDILVQPELGNAQRVLQALDDFGFGSVGLTHDDFAFPNKIVQLGFPPVRIDLITSLTGVSWAEADSGACPGFYADLAVRYLGRKEFILNKRAVGRMKDLADIESLE